ncbi:hypothetical protein ABID21_003679 [Pseudorhizobium tarimense]|uniref:Uncharacterized protein n=1 Tax=Pseudorhizobium tarimense TaxID=1079109 RepID=A0ABV2HAK0_9HYPH
MIIPLPPADCYPEDRHLLCQHAVELAVQNVVASAVTVGWREDEVLGAISAVTDHLALSKAANDELIAFLKELKRRAG